MQEKENVEMKAPDVISIHRPDVYPFRSREKDISDLKEGQEVEVCFGEQRQRLITYVIVSQSPYYIKLKRKSPTLR